MPSDAARDDRHTGGFGRAPLAAMLATTILAGLTMPVAAQEVAANTAADAGFSDDDIIVTAQRRAERLQDVPLSVSAISGEDLINAAATSPERLEQLLPGIRMGRSGAALRPAIRGTYTENVGVNGDPRIGLYVDEIYQSRSQQIAPFLDIARAEVQKGPQGTLFGRNSFGGNITFTSNNPTEEFEGGLDALYGRFNRKRVEGFLNVPIAEGIGLRLAAMGEEDDGYIKNSNPNGNDLGDEDQYFVRGILRFAPLGMDNRLEVLLRGSYLWQGGAGVAGFGYKEVGSLVDRSLIRQPGQSLTRNGVTYLLPNGYNGQSFTGSGLAVDTRYRDGINDIDGVDVGIPVDPDPYKINYEGIFTRRTDQKQFSGTINFDAGPVRLRSITSYTDFENLVSASSLTPVLLNFSYIRTRSKTFTQEVQLLSNDDSSPFQYIVGGYYYDDDVSEHNVTNVNRSYTFATAPAGQQYYFFGLTAQALPAQQINQTFSGDSASAFRQQIESYAAYAQLSYTFADRLTVTGGIRYTSDKKSLTASRFNNGASGGTGGGSFFVYDINDPINFSCTGGIAANARSNASATSIASPLLFACGSITQDFITYRAAVDYKFSRNNLLYASYSTGAHSGGFNTGAVNVAPAGQPANFQLLPFEPEFVEAYEIGTKNTFLDGSLTLNAALFYNRFTDLQAQTSIPNPANPAAVLALTQNIGLDEAYGLDLEATIRPNDNLTVNVNFNYLHAREKENAVNTFNFGGQAAFCNITPSCLASSGETNTLQGTPFPNSRTDPGLFIPLLDPSGNQIVIGGVPQVRYVLAGTLGDGTRVEARKAFQPDYTVQVGFAYRFDLGGAGTITPEVQTYFSSDYVLTNLTPNFGNQPAFTRTDLRLTYRTKSGNFRLQGFVNNLEDQAVITRSVYGGNRVLQAHFAVARTWGIAAGVRF